MPEHLADRKAGSKKPVMGGAEIVLLATPGGAVPQLLAEHGRALDRSVVIDATNDIGRDRLRGPEVPSCCALMPSSPGGEGP
jgi:predicted dinucleotide-binding enzyme